MLLLDHLLQNFPNAKRQTLKRMVQDRRVLINGIPASKLTQELKPEDRIVVASSHKTKASLPFPIVFEDQDILIIDKPPGLLTSTVPRQRRPTAIAAVREYLLIADLSAQAGLIHRLDRDAAGLLVFSKNSRAFESLKRQFAHHTVARVYHALVSPPPRKDSGHIESFLLERADGDVHSTRLSGRGRFAITDFTVAKRRGDVALLRVTLHTGRKHQIRVHLSESGCPVVGDTVYGGKSNPSGLMLAAVELALDHPRTGRRIAFNIDARAIESAFSKAS